MRLLFDENVSPRLVRLLRDVYPDSTHVHDLGLGGADDDDVWNYAATHNFVVVTKDIDFYHRSVRLGHPPKVILLRLGNCPTSDVEAFLRRRHAELLQFHDDDSRSCAMLWPDTGDPP
ncbi:MAG: DUF5615 family PIN-like protein [Dehalococcoidia bacterium]